MLDSHDTDALAMAGYRSIRALDASHPNALLLLREGDRVTCVGHVLATNENRDIRGQLTETRHVLEIYDLVSSDSGALILIEEYAEWGPLGRILGSRQLSPGEIVTALIPLLESLLDLAADGIFPARLALPDVLVDASGRTRIATSAKWKMRSELRGNDEALRSSEAEVRDLVTTIMGSLPGVAERLQPEAPFGPGEWAECISWLLATWQPEPLRRDSADSSTGVPYRCDPFVSSEDGHGDLPDGVHSRRAWIALVMAKLRRLNSGLSRRRRIVFAAGAGAALLALIVTLAIPPAVRSSAPAAPAADSLAVPVHPAAPRDGAASDVVNAIIAGRARCDGNHPTCIDEFDEPESALAREDAQRLAEGNPVRGAFEPTVEPIVLNDLGEAVLIRVAGENATASVLLVQTEAGWRLRDVFD